jgi:hypothetical protein
MSWATTSAVTCSMSKSVPVRTQSWYRSTASLTQVTPSTCASTRSVEP